MFKEKENPSYERYFEGQFDIFSAYLYLTKTDFDKKRELTSILFYKGRKFISISIASDKGEVKLDEEAFIKLFNYIDYEKMEKILDDYINSVRRVITEIYQFTIMNRNYFWNEIMHIKQNIETIFQLSKDKRSLYFRWNNLKKEYQEKFIDRCVQNYRDCLYNRFDACFYFNKFDIITQLMECPELIITDLQEAKILIDENPVVQKDLLTEICNQIIKKI